VNNNSRHRITQKPNIMKTINSLLMMLMVMCLTCISCSKYEAENDENLQLKSTGVPLPLVEGLYNQMWTDDFDTPFGLDYNWRLLGNPRYPLPAWVQGAYGREGLFDNNGPSPLNNYAVSNKKIGKGLGYTIESEVLVKVLNPFGTCVCPGIAVAKNPLNNNEPPSAEGGTIGTGISMRIVFAGASATWFPPKLRGHTWLLREFLSENGSTISSGYIQADMYTNYWHKLKINVTPNRYVRFYCDNLVVWSPLNRLHPTMTSDKNIVLGFTSDGNQENRAGVAYHNYVKAFWVARPEIE
jgi:hypothetical protein